MRIQDFEKGEKIRENIRYIREGREGILKSLERTQFVNIACTLGSSKLKELVMEDIAERFNSLIQALEEEFEAL